MPRLPLKRITLLALPKRWITAVAGMGFRTPGSRFLIPWFIRRYGVNAGEAEKPWREYASLAEFFSRRLREGARALGREEDAVACPVDGVVVERGAIQDGLTVSVKGSEYSLPELLTEPVTEGWRGGEFVVIYLGPGDYHRIHAPCGGEVRKTVRIRGGLFPVNLQGIRWIPGLYAKNERTAIWIHSAGRNAVLACVGSLVVGSVRLVPDLEDPEHILRASREGRRRVLRIGVKPGAELGWFEFGSTVILLFSRGLAEITVQPGERVSALQPIGRFHPELARGAVGRRFIHPSSG